MSAAAALRACPTCGATYDDPRLGFCRVDGTPLGRAAGDPLIGAVVAGRYRVDAPLGEGGMGRVYLAEHLVMQRPVALKIVREELAGDPVVQKRFVREARLASRLAAPNIVQTLDCGVAEDGRLFLAMERLLGETLRERIARGPLPPAEAFATARAILRGLTAAHAAGVVHRDLKPDNVFLCADGAVKVLDFGIARLFDGPAAGPSLTATSAIVGTALYMSPEAVSRAAVGPAADVYALGAILFEMLTGAPPFHDPEPVLLMGMHLRVPAPTLAERTGRAWPAALEALIAAMLAKDPAARPATAAIEAALDAAEAAPVAAPAVARRASRTGLAVAALVVAALSAIGIGVAAWISYEDAPPSPPPTVAVGPAVASPPEVILPPPAPEPPPTVEIRATVTPLTATVTLDGAPVELPARVPADGATHVLVASAEGYVEARRELVADADHDVTLELAPLAIPAPRSPPRPVARTPVAPAPVAARPFPSAPPVRPAPQPAGRGMVQTFGL